MDEGFIEDLAFIRRFNRSTIFRKECNESISKTYVIIQDSRKDNTTLMLVDRRKSKKYWWTHDFSLAYKGNKGDMKRVTKRLHMNNVRIVELEKYLRES
jgi:hypothetical protein